MRTCSVLLTGCLLTLASLALASQACAAYEDWKDNQGNAFRAEPVESLGPLAHFRVRGGAGRMLLWRALAPADCVRFHEAAGRQPARAADWAQAKSEISLEIAGRVRRVQGEKLVKADLHGRPEPQFFILFFANNSVGKSWEMLGQAIEPFNKLQLAHPGLVEGLFFGLWHSPADHVNMAVSMKLPWLVAEFSQETRLTTIARLAPTSDPEAFGMVVVTRHGVPVFSATNPEEPQRKKIFADLAGLLDLMRPDNPRSWPDRAHYLRAVQPVVFAHGRADPVLVGNPLVAEGLRQRKISRVDARIEVDAAGYVTEVVIKPGTGVPENMLAPLGDALKKACVFVPAVDHGKFVAAAYSYLLEVPQ